MARIGWAGVMRVTAHAVMRYQERVENLPAAQIIAILSSPRIIAAAAFGCPSVKLGTGQRVILAGFVVVTIKPSKAWRGSLDPRRDNASNRQGRTARQSAQGVVWGASEAVLRCAGRKSENRGYPHGE